MTEAGILEFDDFCHLRSITLRQAQRAYDRVKPQFDTKRLESLVGRDYQTYAQVFTQQNVFFTNLQKEMVGSACAYLELSPETYIKSVKAYMEVKESAIKVMKADNQVRADLAKEISEKTPIITEEKALNYGYLYMRLDADKEKRMERTKALMQPRVVEDMSRVET